MNIPKIALYILGAAVAVALILTVLFAFPIGCMSAPKKENYTCEECFTAMDCLYRLKDDKDKSACAMLIETCRDTLKEARTRARMEYCAGKKPEKMTESECRLLLNQK
jgi:hypothetical protein